LRRRFFLSCNGDATDVSPWAALDETRRVVIMRKSARIGYFGLFFWREPNADAKLDAMERRRRDKNVFFLPFYTAIFSLFFARSFTQDITRSRYNGV